jgi:hypothetical protein
LSYFKAGNYNQGDTPSEVHFFEISVQHWMISYRKGAAPEPKIITLWVIVRDLVVGAKQYRHYLLVFLRLQLVWERNSSYLLKIHPGSHFPRSNICLFHVDSH